MRKLSFLFVLAVLFLPAGVFAQGGFTTVTGAIVDPGGIPWTGGSISAQLITPGGASPTLNGVSFSGGTVSGLLGPGGTFTIRLGDNGVILPAGTQWKFTINISPGVLPPAGTGPQSFTITTPIKCATNTPATCTSNAMNITATLAPVPALSFALNLNFTPASSATCTLNPIDAPCDNFQFSPVNNACFGGRFANDPPGNTLFSNSAGVCNAAAANGGSDLFVTGISNNSGITQVAMSAYSSTFNTTNAVAIAVSGTAGDDPADTGTGQTFLVGTLDMSLTRAAGSISDMEGLQVTVVNTDTGGAPGAETVGTMYGVRIKDLLAKGTSTTAALQIDAQTAGPNVFAIKVDGGPSQFQAIGFSSVASLVTTAAASDNVAVPGATAASHCSLTARNASAATNIATSFISSTTTNQVTVSHTATANMNYDILCTRN